MHSRARVGVNCNVFSKSGFGLRYRLSFGNKVSQRRFGLKRDRVGQVWAEAINYAQKHESKTAKKFGTKFGENVNKIYGGLRSRIVGSVGGVTGVLLCTSSGIKLMKRNDKDNNDIESTFGINEKSSKLSRKYGRYVSDVSSNVSDKAGYERSFRQADVDQKEDKTMVSDLHDTYLRSDLLDSELQILINTQINLEYSANSFYRSLYAFFDRDNVGLHNIAAYFLEQSDDESMHGLQWIDYMNQRGGKVVLRDIKGPPCNYTILDSFEMALRFEKKVHDNLKKICIEADKRQDYHLSEYATQFLENQYVEMYKLSQKITKLRRMDLTNGTSVYLFDKLEFTQGGQQGGATATSAKGVTNNSL